MKNNGVRVASVREQEAKGTIRLEKLVLPHKVQCPDPFAIASDILVAGRIPSAGAQRPADLHLPAGRGGRLELIKPPGVFSNFQVLLGVETSAFRMGVSLEMRI